MKPLIACGALLASCLLPAAAQPPALPGPVARHYADHNAAAAYSTPAERARLAAFTSAADVRRAQRSPRLERVFGLMQDVQARILEPDPGMLLPDPGGPARAPLPPDLYTVMRVLRQDDRTLVLEVRVTPLDLEANLRFIAAYDRGDRPPDLGLPATVGPAHQAVHEWVRQGDTWLRKGAAWTLLNE